MCEEKRKAEARRILKSYQLKIGMDEYLLQWRQGRLPHEVDNAVRVILGMKEA